MKKSQRILTRKKHSLFIAQNLNLECQISLPTKLDEKENVNFKWNILFQELELKLKDLRLCRPVQWLLLATPNLIIWWRIISELLLSKRFHFRTIKHEREGKLYIWKSFEQPLTISSNAFIIVFADYCRRHSQFEQLVL